MEQRHVISPALAAAALVLALVAGSSKAAANDVPLHYAENFLNSLYSNARIQAPRLQLAALHTFIAHPSLLERWHVINSDAAASYNDWTNTLVLQPEMTIDDASFGGRRLRSLSELSESVGASARVSAGIIFHEMSHAEWDLYVEGGTEDYDRELLAAFDRELPAIVESNRLSLFSARSLASEVFAYYREELIGTILSDTAEIKLASGLEPSTNTCIPRATRPSNARNFSPNPEPYATRVQLGLVWVRGTDVTLDKDKAAGRRLNEALYRHALATLQFPKSRAELLKLLAKDTSIRKALDSCRER
jgi:hypothetical protein